MIHRDERRNQIVQMLEQSSEHQVIGTRALAEHFGVSEMTVRRDLEALAKEGRLRRQHGGAAVSHPRREEQPRDVGVVLVSRTGKYSDPFFNAVLEGVDRRLAQLGYRIAYINTRAEVSTAAQARDLLESHPVSGIILVGPPLGAESIDYLKGRMRTLVGMIDSISPDFDTVAFDGRRGIRMMIDHLVRLGHRRLGYVAGSSDSRHHGYEEGIAAHGLPSDPALLRIVPYGIEGWTPELGRLGAQDLMRLPQPPDAIICGSDLLAIGAIQWLHQNGLRVPDDIAVTGFDNISESEFTAPSLTTVHVHKQLMGELAAERVVRRIEKADEVPLFIQTPVKLVIRRSCGSELAASG
jgi:DNA-binding LacI/PurR family transcriptional regulator